MGNTHCRMGQREGKNRGVELSRVNMISAEKINKRLILLHRLFTGVKHRPFYVPHVPQNSVRPCGRDYNQSINQRKVLDQTKTTWVELVNDLKAVGTTVTQSTMGKNTTL